MDSLRLFGAALLKRWWALMSCAIFTFIGLYALFFDKSNHWLIRASFTSAILLFLVSAFLAWNDEHTAKVEGMARTQQPDVALIWDWPEDVRKVNTLRGSKEKLIMVHNRSAQYVYNVQIAPVKLRQELSFDLINEIAPNGEHVALGKWNGRSSSQTNYLYFFSKNEAEIVERGWAFKKADNSKFSDSFIKIPMMLVYEASGIKWRCDFEFIYDPGDESLFIKKSGGPLC
jgi:hypothetical protein